MPETQFDYNMGTMDSKLSQSIGRQHQNQPQNWLFCLVPDSQIGIITLTQFNVCSIYIETVSQKFCCPCWQSLFVLA